MPGTITILGLGPGDARLQTVAGVNCLQQSPVLYVRTSRHPALTDLTAEIHSFEALFEQHETLAGTCRHIAAKLVRLAQRDQDVVYAVPGHPAVDEISVPFIQTLAQENQVPVTIIPGLSLLDAARNLLSPEISHTLQIVDAFEVAQRHHPPLTPDQPALLTHLHQPALAGAVKKTLRNAYADHFEMILVEPIHNRTQTCRLGALDQYDSFDLDTFLYLPADASNTGFTTFQETVAHLRAPDGCPWDREQTHRSLRPFLLEEAYEVLEALDRGDTDALAEEMGDLLLQIVLHAQIAIDTGEFNMGDVIDHIHQKLLRRHPHVFGDVTVNSVDDVTTNWEAIKKAEKSAKGQANGAPSALDGIPHALPALTQALTISKRAVKMGFEWPNIEGVLDQLIEEAREIIEAETQTHLESEIGDLLFSAVNLARWHNIDPESALRGTNVRFKWRFQKMEALAAQQGKSLSELSTQALESLWNEAKQYEIQKTNGK